MQTKCVYAHVVFKHTLRLLHEHKSLGELSCESSEQLNQTLTRLFWHSTNHQRDAVLQVMHRFSVILMIRRQDVMEGVNTLRYDCERRLPKRSYAQQHRREINEGGEGAAAAPEG